MAIIKIRTKDKSTNVKGKPRVYFTCHPEDLERYFDKICEDIFKTHDCVIYYTPDMTEHIAEEDRETDLGQNNLFVVPVTFRLLTESNRAMDEDIAYAKEKRIPILPFMMETGIDEFYSKPEKFGERQYLSPFTSDLTEMRYEDKLKKHLEAVLISAETAERVRKAFDAYIFLSYRKKDRKYANELMKLIHKNPKYRDIAIWYDEFLTPGESFKENIERAMKDSKLFTLLVTPNLLEEPDGKPNFVMAKEYPMARREGKNILPAEMKATDHERLSDKYPEIPECIDPKEETLLSESLSKALVDVAISENNGDAEHNFLIGLAYLDGIDVEIDRERAITLITSAAEAELPEAMEKLIDIYSSEINYHEELKWRERIYEHYRRERGEDDPYTLMLLNNLAMTCSYLGDYKKARELLIEVFVKRCEILGEEHPHTLLSLNNLAVMCGNLGNYQEASELKEEAYALYSKVLGDEHPDTLQALNNLAVTCVSLGKYERALTLQEKVYSLSCKILGDEHPNTLRSLNNLAVIYGNTGNYRKEIELCEKACEISHRVFGEEHPDTLRFLNNLAASYKNAGDFAKAFEIYTKAYASCCKILGEHHPDTLSVLNNIATVYKGLGKYKEALELQEKVYALRRKAFGEDHPASLESLSDIATTYSCLGELEKALEMHERVYSLNCERFGEEHPDAILSLNNIASVYKELGDMEKALALDEKVYELSVRTYGEEHFNTLISLGNVAYLYGEMGNYEKALPIQERVYALCRAALGDEHPTTLMAIDNLVYTYDELGDLSNGLRMRELACDLRCKLYGEGSPESITAMNDLSLAYFKINEYHKSLEILEKLYFICCNAFGENDPTTDSIKLNLDYVRAMLG